MHSFSRIVLAFGVVSLVGSSAWAAEGSDTDPFEFSQVIGSTASLGGGLSDLDNLFEGPDGVDDDLSGNGVENLHGIFDFHEGNVIDFTRPNSIPIIGIELYNQSDGGEAGLRNVNAFRLLADTDNNLSFETVLVPVSDPTDDGLADVYLFPATTATSFRAEFSGTNGGNRINELDAIVPEPTTLGLLSLGIAATLRRRR